jgi:hypothetical protein
VARELADGLEARGVDYAVGGALGLAQWGVVRGTFDVDLNIWIDPGRPAEAAHLLVQLGCEFKMGAVVREFADKGWAYVVRYGVHVDVYLPTGEFHESVRLRRQRKPLCGREAWFLAAEDLAVLRMILYRTKDRGDVEALLVIRGRDLEGSYARGWLARIAGPSDPRLKTWDEMVSQAEAAIRIRESGWTPPLEEGRALAQDCGAPAALAMPHPTFISGGHPDGEGPDRRCSGRRAWRRGWRGWRPRPGGAAP